MHLVTKQVRGHDYFYLVEKERQGNRVVTSKTVYIGDRRKLAELVTQSASVVMPSSFSSQSVGSALALAALAGELGLEALTDGVCPVRRGAAPVGRRLLLAGIHRIVAPRNENGLLNLRGFYEASVLTELLPINSTSLDGRRMCEMLGQLSPDEVDRIESAIVQRLVSSEGIRTSALAFDCTNFDSYASAKSPSRLLRRGHGKSGKPLRVLGLGLLATEDDGMPLLTFAYPGNENDVTAFKRFLRALDKRKASLDLPVEVTVAADGGNISKQLLLRLEDSKKSRHYVMRLPSKHLVGAERPARAEEVSHNRVRSLASTLPGCPRRAAG